MLMSIFDEIRDGASGVLGNLFIYFVDGLFIFGIVLLIIAIQKLVGKRKNILYSIIFAAFGFILLLFSFQMGDPFGISLMGHGYTGISY